MGFCSYGAAYELYADNLKCVSRDPDLLLNAARFTTGYVRLVGQELAPSKCVLLSTSGVVREGMKDWVLSQVHQETGGLSSLICVIWGVIWILPFGVGLQLWLVEFVWLFLVWC